MKILHIANITDNGANGVCVVVPEHVINQASFADVAFINTNGKKINSLEKYQISVDNDSILTAVEKSFGTPDIVVFHEVNYIEYIAIYKQLIKKCIPYIILPHGEINSSALKIKWLKKKVAYALLFNRFIRNARAVQCLSENEADNIRIKTPQKFIGTNGIRANELTEKSYDGDGVKLFYIGRLEMNHKGLDLLIEAVSDLKDFFIEQRATLDFYGPDKNGNHLKLQKEIDKRGLNELIKVNGPVFDDEKQRVIAGGDIYVQVSRFEGMPMGILEVMSCGVPCVLSKGTNLGEAASALGAGYYAGSSVPEISAALRKAISDKENWREIGEKGRAFIAESFNWSKIAADTVKNYSKLLNEVQ